MRSFLLVLSYFTRIPLGGLVQYSEERYRKGVHYFPFVGLLLWGVLIPIHRMAEDANPFLISAILFAVYIAITGGIHIDGLADSCDGFLSGREKDRVMEIMRDPHIGTFGVLAILTVYTLNLSAMSATCASFFSLAPAFPYVGRVFAYVTASFLPYAKNQGMGKVFVDTAQMLIGGLHVLVLCALFAFLLFYFGEESNMGALFYSLAAGCLFSVLSGLWSYRKIGGLTGDSMGMIIEVGQCAYLVAYSLFYI